MGAKETVFGNTRVEGAVFYSDVQNLIQTVQVVAGATPQTQAQNVGDGEFYGFEVAVDTRVLPHVDIGGNYTYTHREIKDALQPFLQATGVPQHKAFLYMSLRPVNHLTLTPSIEIASNRWSDRATSPALANPYIRTGKYELIHFQAEWQFLEGLSIAGGVKNAFDQNYELSWGLPQQGRNFYAKLRAAF